MPTVKDLTPVVAGICADIKTIGGVQSVYVMGSYLENLDNPNYAVKDVDIIAGTNFDSGDLMAIDNSKYSALRIRPSELEDEGFNPAAVNFTRKFLSFEQYNVDHWATSLDGKLLHWGAIPDSQSDWAELHTEAEKRACKATGTERSALYGSSDQKRKEWKAAYDQYIKRYLASRLGGWYPSDHAVEEVLAKSKRFA
jgi:hypothetical protein